MAFSFLSEKLGEFKVSDRLPFAFFDSLYYLAERNREASMQEVLLEACRLVEISLSAEEVVELTEFLSSNKDKKGEGSRQQKTFSSAVTSWLLGLKGEQICLFVADFDVAKAKDLYFNTPRRLVEESFALKSEFLLERFRVEYEACLYGFGGSYKEDAGGPSEQIDLTADNDAGIQMLKSMGF